MTESVSTGRAVRYHNPTYTGGGESRAPRASFDEPVAAGVDPEAAWRFGGSTRGRRFGTTSAERAGAVAGYTPGYGRASTRNTGGGASSLTPKTEWDAQFQPHLGAEMQPQLGEQMRIAREGTNAAPPTDRMQNGQMIIPPQALTPAGGIPSPGRIPSPGPAPTPSALPVLPPSPGDAHPIEQVNPVATGTVGAGAATTDTTTRGVTGLPAGQRAMSTFAPGQNSPQNLTKRTRPAVDPLAT